LVDIFLSLSLQALGFNLYKMLLKGPQIWLFIMRGISKREVSAFYRHVSLKILNEFSKVLGNATLELGKQRTSIFKKAMDLPEHMEKMEKAGSEVKVIIGDEYGKYLKDLHDNLKRIMVEALKTR